MEYCFDLAVIGHFTIDSIRLPSYKKSIKILGGPPAYLSIVTRRLGGTVTIISKVGDDFPDAYLWWLKEEGVDFSGFSRIENAQTTHFEIDYGQDLQTRTLKLKNLAPSLVASDLPASLQVEIAHVAPVAGEISDELIEKLTSHARLISLDPQGLLRSFDETGKVTFCPKVQHEFLASIDIYKSSEDEITALTGHSNMKSAVAAIHDFGVEIVIVTMGSKGSLISANGTQHQIPACTSKVVVDPTGAGDVFMGGFLVEYIREKDPLWCACVGSAGASLSIENIGPTFLGEKEEIFQRASYLYEKGIKQ